MNQTKQQLKIDLRIYDPSIEDARTATQVKLKGVDADSISIKEILKKYFG